MTKFSMLIVFVLVALAAGAWCWRRRKRPNREATETTIRVAATGETNRQETGKTPGGSRIAVVPGEDLQETNSVPGVPETLKGTTAECPTGAGDFDQIQAPQTPTAVGCRPIPGAKAEVKSHTPPETIETKPGALSGEPGVPVAQPKASEQLSAVSVPQETGAVVIAEERPGTSTGESLRPDAPQQVIPTPVGVVETKAVSEEDAPEPDHEEKESEVAPSTPRPYTGLAAVAKNRRPRTRREGEQRVAPNIDSTLDIRIQLAFDRHGGVRNLALVPCRRRGMPNKLTVSGTHGKLELSEFGDDQYESVPIADADKTLREGVAWKGHGDARGMQWTLSGRELYVLASGDASGIYPFGSTPCLLLHANHVVLATNASRDAVEVALAEAGCAGFTVLTDATPGVPAGWCVFRDVKPTKVVARREGTDFLNPLCPLPDVEPDYVGGIRLRGRVWLAGFPPRIRFTGVLGDDFQVLIDGHLNH